jgi:hypothetical protein
VFGCHEVRAKPFNTTALTAAKRSIALYQRYMLTAALHPGRPTTVDYLRLPLELANIATGRPHASTLASLNAMQLAMDQHDEKTRWRTFMEHTAKGTLSALNLVEDVNCDLERDFYAPEDSAEAMVDATDMPRDCDLSDPDDAGDY